MAIILFALFLAYWFLSRSFLTLDIDPVSATVTVDNAPIKLIRGERGITITPGKHTVKIQADGYIGTVQEIDIARASRKKIDLSLKEIPQPVSIEEKGSFLSAGQNSGEFFYLDSAGTTLYKLLVSNNPDGSLNVKKDPITSARINGVNSIAWSPNKDLALFKKEDGVYLFDFHKYDFVNQTETLWGKDIGDVAWSPDNSKIAYYYAPPSGEKSLIFANTTNTEITRVLNLAEAGIENPLLRWSPDSSLLMLIPRSTSYPTNKIYGYQVYSGKLVTLTESGNQVDAAFSPKGDKILYATYSKDESSSIPLIISMMNIDGGEKRNLTLRAELPKIVWSSDEKNLLVANFDSGRGVESLFSFDIAGKKQAGLLIDSLADKRVTLLLSADDGKIVLYQTSDGIFALNIGAGT